MTRILNVCRPLQKRWEMAEPTATVYNPWFSVRSYLKVYFAEDLGTLILVLGVKG